MDRGAWWPAVRGAAKSRTCLVTEHSTAHTSIKKREKDPRSKFSPILGYQGLGLPTYESGARERKVTF